MPKYTNHDYTEKVVTSEKHLQLDISKVDDLNIISKLGKALSNSDCMKIFQCINNKPMNMIEISRETGIPVSSVSNHIDTLQAAQLIFVNYQPGLKGHAKICYKQVNSVNLSFSDRKFNEKNEIYSYEMDVGMFSDCKIKAPCGMAGSNEVILIDNPAKFFIPKRTEAELLWFSEGFVVYKFPNEVKKRKHLKEISVSMELCSETIYYRDNYPSDISILINDVEILTWTSPGDFGGRRGSYSPKYWSLNSTQFGILKKFKVTQKGVYIDDILLNNNITIENLNIQSRNDIKLTIMVRDDADYKGGINIFGKNFGDHNQAIILTIM